MKIPEVGRQLNLIGDVNKIDRKEKHEFSRSKSESLKFLEDLLKKKRGYQRRFLMDYNKPGTEGWNFFLLSSFKEALDIKYVTKKKREEVLEWQEWQQGSNFSFKRGHMIYDTSDAYDLSWFEALKKIQNCLQVTQATPVVPEDTSKFITKIEGTRNILKKERHIETYNAIESKEMAFVDVRKIVKERTDKFPSYEIFKTMEKLGVVSIRQEFTPRVKGSVNFDMYHLNNAKTGLVRGDSYSATQDDFVRFIITGDTIFVNRVSHIDL
jgi:hypothetical protein